MGLTKKQIELLEGVRALGSLDSAPEGQHWLLPYNRSFSLFPGTLTVFTADFIERPAYYIMRDVRLSKFAGLSKEQAFDLKAQFRLREVEQFYAEKITTSNEDPKSKGGVSGPSEGADSGKGAKPPAKEDSSK